LGFHAGGIEAARANFLAEMRVRTGTVPNNISKMAMRRVLQTAMTSLATDDWNIDELLKHWLATADRSDRKSKAVRQAHASRS
jgi:hypothetical protein